MSVAKCQPQWVCHSSRFRPHEAFVTTWATLPLEWFDIVFFRVTRFFVSRHLHHLLVDVNFLSSRHHLENRCLEAMIGLPLLPAAIQAAVRICTHSCQYGPSSTTCCKIQRSGWAPAGRDLSSHTGFGLKLPPEPFQLFCSSSIICLINEAPRPPATASPTSRCASHSFATPPRTLSPA